MNDSISFTIPGTPVGKGRPKFIRWTKDEESFLAENYPVKGLKWCALHLEKSNTQIRDKASRMRLKQDRNGEFFKEWQSRAAQSKVGKKRPEQAEVIRKAIVDKGLHMHPEEVRARVGNLAKIRIAEKGHPRGALGMKHTKESLEIMSEKSRASWEASSPERREAHARRFSLVGQKSFKNRESATWKAGWREIGGVRKYFRSRWEANYARYLQWLKEKGEILQWEHEPETFWFDGIKRGCMSYLPDFRVSEMNGGAVYHEVKGWMDDRSKTKIKRMAKYHPNVRLLVIDSKEYKSIAKTMRSIIRDWE